MVIYPIQQQGKNLLSNTEFLDDVPVSVNAFPFEVIEQSSSLSNQFQQAAPGVMVLFMGLKMFGQIGDAGAEQRHLHLR